jgi:hypothetical protein
MYTEITEMFQKLLASGVNPGKKKKKAVDAGPPSTGSPAPSEGSK